MSVQQTCPLCRKDLTGLSDPICPACGGAVPPATAALDGPVGPAPADTPTQPAESPAAPAHQETVSERTPADHGLPDTVGAQGQGGNRPSGTRALPAVPGYELLGVLGRGGM